MSDGELLSNAGTPADKQGINIIGRDVAIADTNGSFVKNRLRRR